jgi:hypothetical protein
MWNCHHILFTALAALALVASAGAEDATSARRSELLNQMRLLAAQTEVDYENNFAKPRLNPNPVFRYDDQPRRFIDATMWVWTDEGRPVAFQKVEAKYRAGNGVPEWGYCFGSVSPELLSAEWPGGRKFRSTEPGIVLRRLSSAPEVAESGPLQRRQLRDLARRFSCRIVTDPNNNVTQETRLLTRPLLEYADAKTDLPGAVFAFAANGVNPDVLILLEAREDGSDLHWNFAPARMTSSGVTLRFDESVVWDVPWVNWNEAPFPTWTFFYTPRTPVAGEESP